MARLGVLRLGFLAVVLLIISPAKLNAWSPQSRPNPVANTPNSRKIQWKEPIAVAALSSLVWLHPLPSEAYIPTDYASETVTAAVQSLKEAPNVDSLVKAYENVAEIITEGKGIGGQINFQGVQLERGYIADEDTTLYNPGLSLLTESEKERLVEAIVQSKKSSNTWNVDTQAGYDYLREKLDPFHVYELRGYLSFLPWYGAAVYLIVLGVQQFLRDLFPVAYIVGALSVFLPAIGLVLIGPQ